MSGFVSEKPVPINSPPQTMGSESTSIKKEEVVNESRYARFLHSFRRAEDTSDVASLEEQKYHTDLNKTQEKLKRTMKTRHVTMISLGTGIGTGLLVASGKALRYGGPGGLIIGYITISTMLYCVVQACCELGVAYSSLPGNYNTYPTFLVDRGFGFAVALVYGLQWCIVLPLELVTASMTIKYWETSVNPDVYVAVFYVFIVFIHFFGSRGYAEAEFIFNAMKVLLMAGFIIMGICLVSGASNSGYVGARYWNDPGAFPGSAEMSKFKGVCSVWVQSAFAYGASEFIALTAAEQANPRESVPRATKHWLYRVFIVFLTPMTLVCFLVPYNSNQLLDTAGTSASHASPFVIAAAFHGVKVVPHIINFIILSSVISVGNSAMYSAPRILLSLAENGLFPKMFTYVDREGRPLATLLFACLWGLLSFAAASKDQETIFTWLSAVVGLSQLFTWTAIALSHIRFRAAMKAQNYSIRELGYRANTGVAGSYYALFFNVVVLVAQFWVAIAPIGNGGKIDGVNFLKNYLAFPVLCVFYFGYKIWNRDTQILIPADKIDLQSHRQKFDAEAMMQEELERKERLKHAPMFKKFVSFWC